jgi:hypothetical protein
MSRPNGEHHFTAIERSDRIAEVEVFSHTFFQRRLREPVFASSKRKANRHIADFKFTLLFFIPTIRLKHGGPAQRLVAGVAPKRCNPSVAMERSEQWHLRTPAPCH